MEQKEELTNSLSLNAGATPAVASPSTNGSGPIMPAQVAGTECPTCSTGSGNDAFSHVYAIGRVETRFPSLGLEKEFAQATGRAETAGQPDRQAFHTVLSQPQNRYIARRVCWVFTVEGLEAYILQPRDPTDLDLMIECIRPAPSPMDVDVVIGIKGPIAPPDLCNGLMVPLVVVDQIYSFGRDTLIKSIPRPKNMSAENFTPMARELFDRVLQLADNAGATDEHRALNYLAVRYPTIYGTVADAHGRDHSLTAVEVRPSRLSSTRKIMDVIFSFTHRQSDVTEKYFVRVDVTEEFPFLVTKMSPFYDR
jgi:hypothetical protein